MQDNKKIQWWQIVLAIAIHLAFFIGYITFEDPPEVAAGLQGDIDKKLGSAEVSITPIQISASTGGVEDARQIIAQRKQQRQQEQAAQEQIVNQKETQQKETKTPEPEKKDVTNETTEQAKQREEATASEREKQLALKKEQEAKKKEAESKNSKDNAKLGEQNKQTAPTKPNPTPTPTATTPTQSNKPSQNAASDSQAQAEAAAALEQLRKQKAREAQESNAANQQKALDDLTGGDGGGDGAKKSNYSATDKQRYLEKIKNQILRNFLVNDSMIDQECRVSAFIAKDGTLSNFKIVSGRGNICTAATQALTKTRRVFQPPADIYEEIKNTTFFFRYQDAR